MIKFAALRLGHAVVVTAIVSVMVFLLIHLVPGDPVEALYGGQGLTASQYASIKRRLGLDGSVWQQYGHFVVQLLHGDLGTSLVQQQAVTTLIHPAFLATVELTVGSLVVAVLFGIPAAMIGALRRGTMWDSGIRVASLFGISMPSVWLGIMLILLFSIMLHLLPSAGLLDFSYSVRPITGSVPIDALLEGQWGAFNNNLTHLLMPSVTLGIVVGAVLARVLRSSLLEVMNHEYIEALRARGLSQQTVVRHMLRNALPSSVILMGVNIGTLLGGAIIIEVVFSWPGMGELLAQAINGRDYPLVQGVVLIMAVLFIMVNLVTDVIHGILDPRIRHGRIQSQ